MQASIVTFLNAKERKGEGRRGKEREGEGRTGKGRGGQGRAGKGREGEGCKSMPLSMQQRCHITV